MRQAFFPGDRLWVEICPNILTGSIYGNRVLLSTWPGAMKIYCNKRMCLQREKAQLAYRNGFAHQDGRCVIVLGHQYGCCDVMKKYCVSWTWCIVLRFSDYLAIVYHVLCFVMSGEVTFHVGTLKSELKQKINCAWKAWTGLVEFCSVYV